jgi:hypothetical protein
VSDDAPDFAMVRAVEILAKIAQGGPPPYAPPPPIDRPMLFFSEEIAFEIGATKRADVERAIGVAFSYPTRGWHTYPAGGAKRGLLSAFYKDGLLVAVELYMPRSDRAPNLATRASNFRLIPGELALGMSPTALSSAFVRVPTAPGAYDETYEARFPGGVGYAMTREGKLERFALYAG